MASRLLTQKSTEVLAKGARRFGSAPAHTVLTAPETAAPRLQQTLWDKLMNKPKTPRAPFSENYPGTPELVAATKAPSRDVTVSTLKNGLRVATIESNSPVAHVGVFIDAGSRYENADNTGMSHFLEYMACKSTRNRSDFRLIREMSKIGANVTCSTTRESVTYAGDVSADYVPAVVGTLADVLQNSVFDPTEVKAMREIYEKSNEKRSKAADSIVTEALHEAAYFNSPLGQPFFAPNSHLQKFTTESLWSWTRKHYTAERMVLSAVGVNHKSLEQMGEEMFANLPTSKVEGAVEKKASVWTGGEVRMHKKEGSALTHVAIAFETGSWHDKDLVPLCVLQMMMGGGGSFSAGGPGKGMYSRLYENVLNHHGWVESVQSITNIYTDSGMFGFYATCAPDFSSDMVDVLAHEAHKMTGGVNEQELARARNQLKSQLYMQFERKGVQLEDIGRQVSVYGKVYSTAFLADRIDEVTGRDIQRVASKMLKSSPALAAYGDLSRLPRYEAIAQKFK